MSHYNTLCLESTCTPADIRRAYFKLALLYHPDRNLDGKEKFQEILNAYNILSDPVQRAAYDNVIKTENSILDSADENYIVILPPKSLTADTSTEVKPSQFTIANLTLLLQTADLDKKNFINTCRANPYLMKAVLHCGVIWKKLEKNTLYCLLLEIYARKENMSALKMGQYLLNPGLLNANIADFVNACLQNPKVAEGFLRDHATNLSLDINAFLLLYKNAPMILIKIFSTYEAQLSIWQLEEVCNHYPKDAPPIPLSERSIAILKLNSNITSSFESHFILDNFKGILNFHPRQQQTDIVLHYAKKCKTIPSLLFASKYLQNSTFTLHEDELAKLSSLVWNSLKLQEQNYNGEEYAALFLFLQLLNAKQKKSLFQMLLEERNEFIKHLCVFKKLTEMIISHEVDEQAMLLTNTELALILQEFQFDAQELLRLNNTAQNMVMAQKRLAANLNDEDIVITGIYPKLFLLEIRKHLYLNMNYLYI